MKIEAQPGLSLLAPTGWDDYELLDSGGEARLERFGCYTFVRPEPQALWRRAWPEERWQKADAVFQPRAEGENGKWIFHRSVEPRWPMRYRDLSFWAQPTPFRHMGVFPEHATQWDWARGLIEAAGRPIRVLNLFGYTGLFSLAAAASGARVTHVDASKKTIAWARDNQSLSRMDQLPIRWLVDDALKFVQREARRSVTYDGFVIDPPKYGRGPKGEVWRVQESLPALLDACRQILSPQPLFVVLSAYAIKVSALSLHHLVAEMMQGRGGTVESGEMVLSEKSAGRLLSCSVHARWS
jgi:23S rRNA (cytosine1962-C5)-methyltransferase